MYATQPKVMTQKFHSFHNSVCVTAPYRAVPNGIKRAIRKNMSFGLWIRKESINGPATTDIIQNSLISIFRRKRYSIVARTKQSMKALAESSSSPGAILFLRFIF